MDPYPENDTSLPLMLRNLYAEENRNPAAWPRGSDRDHMSLSKIIAQAFEEQWGDDPFMGYVLPFEEGATYKVHKFNARWLFELAQDSQAKSGISQYISAMAGELIAETMQFSERHQVVVFPYLVWSSDVSIDPMTFEPKGAFSLKYKCAPRDFKSPIDFTKSPSVGFQISNRA